MFNINTFIKRKKTCVAVLIDPDKFNETVIINAQSAGISFFLVGGSRLYSGNINQTVSKIKKLSPLPVVLFPGDEHQISKKADALLLPCMIAGTNAEYISGKAILAAKKINYFKANCLATAYILFDGKKISETQKITKNKPLKNNLLLENIAIAASLLGLKAIYLEAGSGAKHSVRSQFVKKIKKHCALPIIIGGGINTPKKFVDAYKSGANVIVIGNILETNFNFLNVIKAQIEAQKQAV
ncbi:MAG: geranylgeranylglyceryl phosphate synthase family protein [Bacteroidetes bacterium]|nr:geranylgeranylglyceryl phosphate synthase family protein [Bacteroidota bacterium]